MCLNLIPLYLTMEPDLLYVLMMLAGVAMAIIFKAGKHYSPQVSVKRSNAQFQVQGKKKKEVVYVYDVKAMVQAKGTGGSHCNTGRDGGKQLSPEGVI